MNEWQLQEDLENRWSRDGLFWKDKKWSLVTRELMFPSWTINNNKKKWNEPSVDFVLFDGEKSFLILELKYEIKGPVKLLEAFCQVQHSAQRFLEGYSPQKMSTVAVLKNNQESFYFPIFPQVELLVMALTIPKKSKELLEKWNGMNAYEIKRLIGEYSARRVFERFEDVIGEVRLVESKY